LASGTLVKAWKAVDIFSKIDVPEGNDQQIVILLGSMNGCDLSFARRCDRETNVFGCLLGKMREIAVWK
jgi:hypothetical protein